ncbi:MAG: hypothetical protein ACRDL3_02930 [Solirubrobacterales bacterium]
MFEQEKVMLRRPRFAWAVLAFAMAIAAGVLEWAGSDTGLLNDELFVFSTSRWDLEYLLSPHNEHLTLPMRIVYQAVFATVGPEYGVIRAIGVVALFACVALFFELARRRLGPPLALPPSMLLLFLGLGWQSVLWPFGVLTTALSIAAGLGALLALERDDRTGDILAAVLVALSVATFSIGLAFLVGIAVSILLRPDRWRRAWIFLVPLVLYAAWWVWAQKFDQPGAVSASNIAMIPEYFVDSLAAVLGALAGLNELVGLGGLRAFDASGLEAVLGAIALAVRWAVVVLAVAALVVRLKRGRIPSSLWVSLAILTTYWLAGSLAQGAERVPDASRYILPGAIGVLLVATDAARGRRLPAAVPAVVLAVFAFSLAANLHELRDAGNAFRGEAGSSRAQLAALELADGAAHPTYLPGQDPSLSAFLPAGFPVQVGPYLAAAERFGSPAYSLEELRAQDERVRRGADAVLTRALDLRLEPAEPDARPPGCREPATGEALRSIDLPRGGALLRAERDAQMALARFADLPFFGVGGLAADRPAAIRAPPDLAPEPWRAGFITAGAVEICPL